MIMAIRYHDTCICQDGRWLFAHRQLITRLDRQAALQRVATKSHAKDIALSKRVPLVDSRRRQCRDSSSVAVSAQPLGSACGG
jgi:hypothetical protein